MILQTGSIYNISKILHKLQDIKFKIHLLPASCRV